LQEAAYAIIKKKLVNKKILVNTKNIISIHTLKLEILSVMS